MLVHVLMSFVSAGHYRHEEKEDTVNWEIFVVQIFWMTCWYPKIKNTKLFDSKLI